MWESIGGLISDQFYRAGAQWRTHASNKDYEMQQWDLDSYHHWLRIIDDEKQKKAEGKPVNVSGLGVCTPSLSHLVPCRLTSDIFIL